MVDERRDGQWWGEEAEKALAAEFLGWYNAVREGLSARRMGPILGIGRNRINAVLNNEQWYDATNTVRVAWLANRERWRTMTLEKLRAEAAERKAKQQAAALGAEAEQLDAEGPDEVATGESGRPASGVSTENGNAGKGVQPDVGQPDVVAGSAASSANEPAPADDAPGLTDGERVQDKKDPDAPPADADAYAGGAPASDGNEPAPAGDAPRGGDAPAGGDASGEGADEEQRLSLTGEPLMPAGLDLEDMIALVDASNAAKYGQVIRDNEICRSRQ